MHDLKDKTSEGLASIVVAYRAFSLFKEEAKEAMSELLRRKDSGELFQFDKFISSELEKLPKPTSNDVIKVMKTLASKGIK